MPPSPYVALTIAGSDCSAGAGLQADLKTFSCFGIHGLTAVTAVVAETPLAVHGIYPVEPSAVREQVESLLAAYPIAAVKTGMLGAAPQIAAVADLLTGRGLPLVVDPVLVASTGDSLAPEGALSAYREQLLPLATIMTPNLPEALALLDLPPGEAAPPDALARELSDRFGCAVLLTGGHGSNHDEAVDFLVHENTLHRFAAPWIEVAASHGTGCTVSAAITSGLAAGRSLHDAVAAAKDFIGHALMHSYGWSGPGRPAIHALNQLPGPFSDATAANGCGASIC